MIISTIIRNGANSEILARIAERGAKEAGHEVEFVTDGIAFSQTELLNEITDLEFFNSQSYTGVAYNTKTNEIVGLYILHPNNVGKCGHISNASYAVKKDKRGNI